MAGDGVELPPWLEGPRVARVFLDAGAARDQGFADEGLRGGTTYSIVLQQGLVQLWLPTYRPLHQNEVLSEEAYLALERARLRPEGYGDAGSVRGVLGQLGRLLMRRRPWIDVSEDGLGALSYVPLPPDEDAAPRGAR